eukprot:jgi/Tetstr1/447305/TSEL_034742.t1
MAEVYTTITPTNDLVSYTSVSPSIDYVEDNVISTFGPIYTPKLYSSELTALEIASSGKIAITLLDEHAFDISDDSSNNVLFTARDGNSWKFHTENDEAFLTLDTDSNAVLSASNDLTLFAQNAVALSGASLLAETSGAMVMTSSASNMVLSAPAGTFEVDAAIVDIDSTGDAFFSAVGAATLESTGGDLALSAPAGTLDADANAVTVDSATTVAVTGQSTVSLASGAADVQVVAGDGTFDVDALFIDMDASGTASVTAAGAATLESTAGDIVLSAPAGTLDADASAVTVDAATTMAMTADSTASLTSTSADVKMSAVAGTFEVDAAAIDMDSTGPATLQSTGAMTFASESTVQATAADTISVAASNDVAVTSETSDVSLSAPLGDILLSAPTGTVTIDAQVAFTQGIQGVSSLVSDSDILIQSGSNVRTTAALDASIGASNAVSVSAKAGGLTLESRDSNVAIDAGDDIYITALNNVFVTAQNTNIELSADDDLVMSSATGDATLTTSVGDVSFSSARILSATSATATSLTAGTSMDIAASAGSATITADNPGGNVVAASLASTGSGNYTQVKAADDGKQLFTIGNYDAIEIYKTSIFEPSDSNNNTGYKVKVNADFEILGTVNSIGITQTELQIQDKIIHLAYNSNLEDPADGPFNTGAGIMVDGVPSAADPDTLTDYPERYEKSIKWNHGVGGMLALGGTNVSEESYWEVQGGAMRWTYVNEATGKETSYILRINEREEFEMVKRSKELGGSETFTRVSKFGRII